MAARKKTAFRSGMEQRLVPALLAFGAEYEPVFLRYASRRSRHYKPDVVLKNGIAIEIKGWFRPADRAKLLDVKAEYPQLDLRMVLASPRQKLSPKSKTTQAEWCEQHGIPWSEKEVPAAWLSATTNEASLAILAAAPRVNKTKAAA